DVVGISLCVFNLDVEIAVVGKDAGVDQLKLRLLSPAAPVLLDQPTIREGGLRILIEHPHVRVGRRAIEVIVKLFDVFAVIALGIGQPEQPLFQDRVASVPQRKAETQKQPVIAKAADPILTPAIGPAASMIVRKIFPSRAVFAVILAHRSPLALAEIRSPSPPVDTLAYFFQTRSFRGTGSCRAQPRLC